MTKLEAQIEYMKAAVLLGDTQSIDRWTATQLLSSFNASKVDAVAFEVWVQRMGVVISDAETVSSNPAPVEVIAQDEIDPEVENAKAVKHLQFHFRKAVTGGNPPITVEVTKDEMCEPTINIQMANPVGSVKVA